MYFCRRIVATATGLPRNTSDTSNVETTGSLCC